MKLVLLHKQYCPYSAKVRDYIEENGLKSKIEYRDIMEDDEAMAELKELTRDHQVPCLVIDGKPLLESDRIIDWLGKNLAKAA